MICWVPAVTLMVNLHELFYIYLADRLEVNQMLSGKGFDYHCHSNLTRAIIPYGLNESDVHDVLNVFQVTGLTKNGEYFM